MLKQELEIRRFDVLAVRSSGIPVADRLAALDRLAEPPEILKRPNTAADLSAGSKPASTAVPEAKPKSGGRSVLKVIGGFVAVALIAFGAAMIAGAFLTEDPCDAFARLPNELAAKLDALTQQQAKLELSRDQLIADRQTSGAVR